MIINQPILDKLAEDWRKLEIKFRIKHSKLCNQTQMSNLDFFDKELNVGDSIVVCYDKNGYFTKATIIADRGRVWRIKTETRWGSTQEKNIDKNPRRIVKVC